MPITQHSQWRLQDTEIEVLSYAVTDCQSAMPQLLLDATKLINVHGIWRIVQSNRTTFEFSTTPVSFPCHLHTDDTRTMIF